MNFDQIRKYALDHINNDFYKTYFFRYLRTDKQTREAAINHWIKCHAENVLSNREDLIIFSGKMLGMILLAEKYDAFKKNNMRSL